MWSTILKTCELSDEVTPWISSSSRQPGLSAASEPSLDAPLRETGRYEHTVFSSLVSLRPSQSNEFLHKSIVLDFPAIPRGRVVYQASSSASRFRFLSRLRGWPGVAESSCQGGAYIQLYSFFGGVVLL